MRNRSTLEILREAHCGGYAVGAFEVWNLESVRAVIAAAEAENLPVILQAGPLEIAYAGIEEIASIASRAIEKARVPAVLHLDHGNSYEQVLSAIEAGFDSVMLDASHLPYEQNVALTKKVVQAAHEAGLTAEAEIGRVGGIEERGGTQRGDTPLTSPEEAKRFVEETNVDFLAVAIGTRHGFYKSPPKIDFERLEKIAKMVDVPLVLHGGSDTPEESIRKAVRLGISKVNISTEFIDAFARGFHDTYAHPEHKTYVSEMFGPARARAEALVRKKIRLFALKD